MEWFLLIICKEDTLTGSATPFSKNHHTLCFWLRREWRQMPNTEQWLHQTDKNSHRRCSIKKAALKNFAIVRKMPALESLFNIVAYLLASNFIRKRVQHRCFPTGTFLRKSILQNASVLTLGSNCSEFCFWIVTLKIILTL